MGNILENILEEPEVVMETLGYGERNYPKIISRLEHIKFNKIYMIGCGSSNFVGLAGRYVFEEFAQIPVIPLSSKDFQNYALKAIDSDSIIIAISQSGESYETITATEEAKKAGIYTVALTNKEKSRLAQLCDDIILLKAGVEDGPGTKTVVAQCMAMYQFALFFAKINNLNKKNIIKEAMDELYLSIDLIKEMLSDKSQERLKNMSLLFNEFKYLYIVGGGPFTALSFQAANIMREVGKIHCYPFEATEFRHGPLEVVSNDSLLMIFTNRLSRSNKQIENLYNAIKNLEINVIYCGDSNRPSGINFKEKLLLPSVNEYLASQIYLPPIQLLSYMVAKNKGFNPNIFQNIVKTWQN